MDFNNIDELRALRAEFLQQEQWTDLVKVLEQWRKLSVEPARIRALQEELVEVLELMLQLDDAKVVDLAEMKLEELYRERGTPEAYLSLANLYLDCAERNSDDVEAYAVARRACAHVFEQELNEPASGLLVLTSALGSDVVFQRGFLADIERLAAKTNQWREVCQSLSDVLGHLDTSRRSSSLLLKLGDWTAHFDPEEAQKLYRRVLSEDHTNMPAIERLEASLGSGASPKARAELLEAKATALGDSQESLDALVQAGRAYEAAQDLAGALQCYERAHRGAPGYGAALDALQRIYGSNERWEDYVRILRAMEAATDDIEMLSRIQERIAEALSKAGAVEDAIRHFRGASVDPRDLVSRLKTEAESANTEHARGRFWAEIGNIYSRDLSDALSAQHYYEKAISHDSQIVDAAEPLVDVYLSERNWEAAAPLLEAILRNADSGRSSAWLHKRYLQYAQATDRLKRPAVAIQAYRQAYELNPSDVPTLSGFAGLLVDMEDWDLGLRILTVLVENHGRTLDPHRLVNALFLRGVCLESMGEELRSIAAFEQVISCDPKHRDALRILTEYYDERQNWPKYVEFAPVLLEVEVEPLVRFRRFTRLGEVWANELNRPDLAMQAYRGAIDIQPESIAVMRRLLDLYTKERRFSLAVKVLERLLSQEESPRRRATLHYTAGVLNRDEVRNLPEAVRHFDAALDCDPEMLKSFEAIDRILTQAREWKELERAYRRMIQRIGDQARHEMQEVEVMLWSGLAEIYRSRLGHLESAANALQVLHNLTPEDLSITSKLAEIFERAGDTQQAIREHRYLIDKQPRGLDSYHALHNLYMASSQYDAAWCVASSLAFMRAATYEEDSFHQRYIGHNLKLGRGVITPDELRRVSHPAEDVLTSMILSYVSQTLRPLYSTPLKSQGINVKKQVLPKDSKHVFRKLTDYISQSLGHLAPPELYLSKTPGGMKNLNAEVPAILVGTDRIESSNDRENAFLLGKLFSAMRPEHYLASLGFPAEAIQTLFMAALEACDPSLKYSKQLNDSNFDRAVKDLRKMPEPLLLQLRKLVSSFLSRGTPVNIPAWLAAVDHSSSRIGLVLCGDLTLAASTLRYGTVQIGGNTDESKLEELNKFAISEEYLQIRRHLHLTISDR